MKNSIKNPPVIHKKLLLWKIEPSSSSLHWPVKYPVKQYSETKRKEVMWLPDVQPEPLHTMWTHWVRPMGSSVALCGIVKVKSLKVKEIIEIAFPCSENTCISPSQRRVPSTVSTFVLMLFMSKWHDKMFHRNDNNPLSQQGLTCCVHPHLQLEAVDLFPLAGSLGEPGIGYIRIPQRLLQERDYTS